MMISPMPGSVIEVEVDVLREESIVVVRVGDVVVVIEGEVVVEVILSCAWAIGEEQFAWWKIERMRIRIGRTSRRSRPKNPLSVPILAMS